MGRHVLWEFPDTGYLDVVDTIAPVAADRENIGQQTSSILRSGLFEHRFVPTLAFGGREAAAPTLGPGEQPRNPPGTVVNETADPQNGAFSGTVEMDRPGGRDLQGVLRPPMGGYGRRPTRRATDAVAGVDGRTRAGT